MINIYSPDRQELRQGLRVEKIIYQAVVPESPGSKGRVMIGKLMGRGVTELYDVPLRMVPYIEENLVQGDGAEVVLKPQHHLPKRDIVLGLRDSELETVVEIKRATKT